MFNRNTNILIQNILLIHKFNNKRMKGISLYIHPKENQKKRKGVVGQKTTPLVAYLSCTVPPKKIMPSLLLLPVCSLEHSIEVIAGINHRYNKGVSLIKT